MNGKLRWCIRMLLSGLTEYGLAVSCAGAYMLEATPKPQAPGMEEIADLPTGHPDFLTLEVAFTAQERHIWESLTSRF
jgi:hypothetical protein